MRALLSALPWLLLVPAGCSGKNVVGKWEVIRDRPNCGWKKGDTAGLTLTLGPGGEAKQMFSSTDIFWSADEGRWSVTGSALFEHGRLSLAGSTLELDFAKTTVTGGTLNERTVLVFDYERVGDELRLSPKLEKHYGTEKFATPRTFAGEERCAVAYRKVADLVE